MHCVSKNWILSKQILGLTFLLSQYPLFAETKIPTCSSYPTGNSYAIQLDPTGHLGNTHYSLSPDGNSVFIKEDTGSLRLFSINSGKAQDFPLATNSQLPDFSPDGKWILVHLPDRKVTLFDPKTGQNRLLSHPASPVEWSEFSPNGQSVMTASSDGKILLHDLSTGNARTIKLAQPIKGAHFTPDGNSLIALRNDTSALGVLFNLQSGAQESIELTPGFPFSEPQFSSDGKYVIAGSNMTNVLRRLGQPQTPEKGDIDLGQIIFASFSKDGKKLITHSVDGDFIYRNLVTGEKQIFKGLSTPFTDFSPDGKWLYLGYSKPDHGISLLNFDTGKTEIIHSDEENMVSESQFSPDGKFLTLGTTRGEIVTRNLSTGAEQRFQQRGITFSLRISQNDQTIVSLSNQQEFSIVQLASVCVDPTFNIRAPESCTLCRNNPVLASEQMLNELQQETRCQEAFDPKLWDKDLPIHETKNLSDESAKALLLRFQKPGSFDPQKHLSQLLAIFKSDLPQRKPDLVMGALQTVMHTSNQLYERLLSDFPALTRLKPTPSATPNACRTPAEVQILEQAAINYLKNLTVQNTRSKFKDWHGIIPLAPLLNKLSPEQKDDYIDKIAQSLADAAADTSDFHGIFLSKLYKLTSQAAAPLLGEKRKNITDLTLIRERDSLRPVILGVEPLDSLVDSKTDYGFYAKTLPAVSADGQKSIQEIRWKMGEQPYQAQLSVEVMSSKLSLVPQGRSPNYSELWKNGTLAGLVITGSNLKGTASNVMGQYLAYYQEQGFKFQPLTTIQDAPSFLQEQIASGDLQYLIKEAHSDGDEKNLFRLNLAARLQTGERTLPNGRKERIHLLFPTSEASPSVLLSNHKFGEMLKLREKAGHGQFVYFNTSCWSKTKAIYEIEAAQTPLLLNIPSTTSVEIFRNEPKDAERLMLTAFRNGKSFDEIRRALSENKEYRLGHQNHFIFPDDPEYYSAITSLLAKPIKTEIKILGPDGKPYQIDEAH